MSAPHIPIAEQWTWQGRIRIVTRDRLGRITTTHHLDNLITDSGKTLLAAALNQGTDSRIRYLAWGDNSTAPAAGDTTLGNELGRVPITSVAAGATAGEADTITFLDADSANTQIEELGWFAGATATAATDSGVLLARVLYSKNKNHEESIQITRTDDLA